MPHPLLDRIERRLPGPAKPVWRLTANTVADSIDDRVPGLAAEAAFFALLSVPPLLLVAAGAIGFVGDWSPQVEERLLIDFRILVGQVLAPETVDSVMSVVGGIVEEGRADLISLGIVIALWSASRATGTFITAVTIAYDLEDPRPVWKVRLIAFALTLAGAAVLVVLIPALVIGPDLVARLAPAMLDRPAETALRWAFWPAVGLLTIGLLASLYHVGVPWRTPWRRDLPGAFLAMGLWFLGSYGLRFYAELTLRGEGAALQSLAWPLVVLLWMFVTTLAVLLGAELNAEIEKLWPHDSELSRHVGEVGRDQPGTSDDLPDGGKRTPPVRDPA